jgi:hypothetical protein
MGAITIRLPARETYRAEPALLVIDTTVNSGSEWGWRVIDGEGIGAKVTALLLLRF